MSNQPRTINLDQIKLVTALCNEVSRQIPGITVCHEQLNVIIAAANSVKAAYDGTPIAVINEGEE